MPGLSASTQRKAEEELFEKPGKREQDIELLRKLVISNKALTCKTDAEFLVRFLRARKFDIQRANDLLINYYSVREEHKDQLSDLRPSTVRHIFEAGSSIILPHRDRHGRRIAYIRAGAMNPKEHSPTDGLRADILNFEMMAMEEETQVHGVVAIMNAENLGWDHVKAYDSGKSKLFTRVMQESFPLRFKGFYVVNQPAVFDVLMAVTKPFMSAKLLSRMNLIGSDLGKLHEVFDPAILPEELGGDLPSGDVLAKDWCKKVLAQEATFAELTKYKIETTKTIGKGKDDSSTASNGAAITGTFRKLNID